MNGLVLTAGGARGAYQAGVLKRIAEIPRLMSRKSPFQVVTGASAGAINGAAIAAGSEDFTIATRMLAELWGSLEMRDVFKTDPFSLGLGSARWLKDLSLGGVLGGGGAQSLLDFTPLRKYLAANLRFDQIPRAIESGSLYAVAISATSYYSGQSFTFIEGRTGHPIWEKSRRTALSVALNVDHIWASCAIPVIFQPVKVETSIGSFYFGDGGLRLVAPFSPAIRLGASRVFAIGIRSHKSTETRLRASLLEADQKKPRMRRPPMAQIIGVTLNSIFLDHLDTDFEHLNRMNELLRSYGGQATIPSKTLEPMRTIDPFVINPSEDLATIAEAHGHNMPKVLSYFMEGLGTNRSQSADLMSYLLFDSSYTRALIDIGYKDAHARADEIEAFLASQ
jgi:NTE family protein